MKSARQALAGATLAAVMVAAPAATHAQESILYRFGVEYAPNGAIVGSQDSVNGNWTYTYDPLDRLTGASAPGRAFSYEYDRNGNRWRQNLLEGQGPSRHYSFNPASNRIVGMTYDALGNIVSDGVHTYTYDAENRLIQVDGGATASYAYDALGRRVLKSTSAGATEYLYDPAGRPVAARDASTGTLRSAEVYAGSRHLATYARGRTYFHHEDWLGSSRLTTLPDGAVTEQCTDQPFGDAVACAAGTGHEPSSTPFAGYERDRESQLDHTWFRQYSSAQGRWTTPDPFLGSMDPSNPQSLNRYSYVLNDPLNMTDPLGLDGVCTVQNDKGGEDLVDDANTEAKCKAAGGTWTPTNGPIGGGIDVRPKVPPPAWPLPPPSWRTGGGVPIERLLPIIEGHRARNDATMPYLKCVARAGHARRQRLLELNRDVAQDYFPNAAAGASGGLARSLGSFFSSGNKAVTPAGSFGRGVGWGVVGAELGALIGGAVKIKDQMPRIEARYFDDLEACFQ